MSPKHTSAGLSPEHHPRKSGMGGDGKGQKNESENQDLSMAPSLMTRLVLKKSQLEMAGRKAQTAYLMVQHADNLREKAERKILLGGSCKIVPNASPPKEHGPQLETQTESRERFIKELAKRAGFSFPGSTIRTLRFSHQTKGDSMSAPSLITMAQPWQRSKLYTLPRTSSTQTN